MAAGRNIKGITVEIDGDTTGLQRALSGVNTEIKNTQSALRDVEKLLKLDPTNTELLAQKQRLLTDAVSETKEKLETLKTAAEQANEQLANGDITQEQYDALQREIVDTEQRLRNLETQAATTNAALAKIDAVGTTLENVGGKITSAGKKVSVVSTAVAGLGAAAVSTASDFDTAMSQVQATMGITVDAMSEVDGETVNTMDTLRDLAKEMGKSTAFSASECAEALNYLALAGYDTQQMCDTLPTVLNLAAAGSIDLAGASDMVTDAMSALGMETSEADMMVDQMAKTASSTNTSVAQLGEGILKIGATAKSMKGGTAELSTALGILANNGIKGAEGGTHLRNVILSLQSPTDTAADCMEELGLSAYDSEGEMRSLNDILGDLNASMDGMTSAEKNDIISTIFNKTDLSSVNALLANTGDTWDELQNTISNSAGAAQKMADTQLDNLSGQITLLKSALEGLAISIGEILMPAVRNTVSKVQNFVDWLNSLSDAQKELIVKIGSVVATLGPFLVILGTIISKVGTTMKAFSSMAQGVAKLGAKLAGGSGSITSFGSAIAAVSGPVLIVVAVIGTLVAAFMTLWNTNEEFREKITAIWEGISNRWKEFCSGIVERINALGFEFEDITEVLKAIWTGFCDLLAPVFEGAFSAVAAVIDTVLDVITGILDIFIGLFTGNWDQCWTGVQEVFGGIWDGITDIFKSAADMLIGIADTILGWFGSSWEETWNGIKEFFQGIPRWWAGIWQQVGDFFAGIWSGICSFFTETIPEAWQSVVDWFKGIPEWWAGIWQQVGDFFAGIWTTMMQNPVISGIVTTITDLWNNAVTTLQNIWTNIKAMAGAAWEMIKNIILGPILLLIDLVTGDFEQLKSDAQNIWENIKNAASTIWNALKDLVGNVVHGLITHVTTLITGLKDVLSNIWEMVKQATSEAWENLKTTVVNAATNLKDSAVQAVTNLKESVSQAWENMKSAASEAWQNIKQFVIDTAKNLKESAVEAFKNLVSGSKDTLNNLGSVVSDGFQSAIEFITSLPSQAVEWGKDFIMGIVDGIREGIGWVTDAVSDVADKIRSFLHFSVPDEGPLTEYESWMPDFMEGLANGINKSKRRVTDAISKLSAEMSLELQMPDITQNFRDLSAAGGGQNNEAVISAVDNLGNRMISIMSQYFPQFANQKIVMDTGAMVGAIAPEMDMQLGRIADHKGRGI